MFHRDTVNNVAAWLGRAHELADGVEHLAQHGVDTGRRHELVDFLVRPPLEQLGEGVGIVGVAQIAHGPEDYRPC